MADNELEKIGRQLPASPGHPAGPPLHLWQPELSGDIDIRILRDGTWLHEGQPIRRPALVRLFASILRREADGAYYLVTPVEKWRIRVDCLPLIVVDFDLERAGCPEQRIVVATNIGRSYLVGPEHPLFLFSPDAGERIPAVRLEHGLAALFSRAAWYRLAQACEERDGIAGVASGGGFFPISDQA